MARHTLHRRSGVLVDAGTLSSNMGASLTLANALREVTTREGSEQRKPCDATRAPRASR